MSWLSPHSDPETHGRRRLAPAALASLVAHALLAIAVLWLMSIEPAVANQVVVPEVHSELVYLQVEGPGGGGGGSPNPAPPVKIEIPKMPDVAPPPVVPPADIPVTPPPPVPQMNVPVVTNAADVLRASGITGVAPTGPGGGGRGTGIGPGDGPGLGPGSNGGTGGKVYGIGSGVVNPTIMRQVDPTYTPDAMRDKRQGEVTLDCVVLPNGLIDPASIRVVKSLDRSSGGLDQAAIDAAKKWIFRPGTLNGVPVSVQIRLIIEFRLR